MILKNNVVKGIAEEVGRTPAQVLLNFSVTNDPNVWPIAKSSNAGRIEENFGSVGWRLGPKHVESLRSLNADFRYFDSYVGGGKQWHDGIEE